MEDNLRRSITLKLDPHNRIRNVSKILGYTMQKNHDVYFGDSLRESYTVIVEERAKGIPLIGGITDQVKGLPVWLPQNLFVLHPLRNEAKRAHISIIVQVLDTAQSIWDCGLIPMDLSSQNVFFDPSDRKITVVDEGITMNRKYLDLHDFYLEVISSYITPTDSPLSAAGYRKSTELVVVPEFTKTVDHLIKVYSSNDNYIDHIHMLEILYCIKSRSYLRISEFKKDLIENVNHRIQRLGNISYTATLYAAWQDAMHYLYSPYWEKFLFDPLKDLSVYA